MESCFAILSLASKKWRDEWSSRVRGCARDVFGAL